MAYEKDNELFSKIVKAGKRTYFFDVKATKGNDLFLTITESKKTKCEGIETYQKHKIFLYKEDFIKFKEAIEESIEKIQELNVENSNSI